MIVITFDRNAQVLGVFGGFVAFGFLGLFIGPTLIAIAFTLLEAWRRAGREASRQNLTLGIPRRGRFGVERRLSPGGARTK